LGAKYDATYVVFALTAIAGEKLTCCHPVDVSLANVADPRRVPLRDHRWPTCAPVFCAPL
jgi:hypothetical protein